MVMPRTGYIVALGATVAGLTAWLFYQRRLPAESRGAWWSHATTAALVAVAVALTVEMLRTQQAQALPAGQTTAAFPGQQVAGGQLPAASGAQYALPAAQPQDYPTSAADDIDRLGFQPDAHVRVSPEGLQIFSMGQWRWTRIDDLESLHNARILVTDAGARSRVWQGVINALQRNSNQIVEEH